MTSHALLASCSACTRIRDHAVDVPSGPERIIVHDQAELPAGRFPLDRKPSELLTDAEAFDELSHRVSADIELTLATQHHIQDAAAQDSLYTTLRDIALLRGDATAARDYNTRLRALRTKPSPPSRGSSILRHARHLCRRHRTRQRSVPCVTKHSPNTGPKRTTCHGAPCATRSGEMRDGADVPNADIITGIIASQRDPVWQASVALNRESCRP